jgi:hypothetical protein
MIVAVLMTTLGGAALAVPMSFDDEATGNWSAPATWGETVEYPGRDRGSGPEADDVTVDTGTVTGDVVIPTVVTPITVKTGGTLYFNNTDQSVDVTLDGGQLKIRGYNSGGEQIFTGDVTVLSPSEVYTTGHSNHKNSQTAYINGDIKDGATTGRLHFTGEHISRCVLGGTNTAFSGGMLVDIPGYLKLTGDGAAGSGTLTVNTTAVVGGNQSSGNQPTFAVVDGGTLNVGNWNQKVTVNDWDIDMNGGALTFTVGYASGKTNHLLGGSLDCGTDPWEIRKRWGRDAEIGSPVSGSGDVTVSFYSYDGRWGGGAILLTGDNSGFSGDIYVEGLTTAGRTVLAANAPNSLGGNNSILVDGDAELEIGDPAALNGTNTVYLLAGSNGVMDLQADAVVYSLNLGGTYDEGVGEVEGGTWIDPGVYGGAEPFVYQSQFDGYVEFNGHLLTVLNNPMAIPEPAGLSLMGLALLGLRKKRS